VLVYWDWAATPQSSSNSPTFRGISLGGINIIKPPQTSLRVLLSEYCGTIGSPSYACQPYLTVLRLHLFCDYRNYTSTSQANHNFPNFSLTNMKFPDFSRYSRCEGHLETGLYSLISILDLEVNLDQLTLIV